MTHLAWVTRQRQFNGRVAPSALDWSIGAVLLAIALAEALGGAFPGPFAIVAVAQVPAVLPVAFRRIAPVQAIAVMSVVALPYVVLFGEGNSLANMIAVLVIIYSVGRHASPRGLLAGVGFSLLLEVELGLGGRLVTADDFIYVGLLFAGAMGFGVALRAQVQRSIAFALAADRAQREQDVAAEAAVQAERARIARELHDVVAHNVGLIVLQAGGARSILDTDLERARAALRQVEETGRQTLAEMRHLVGILRVDGDAERQPLPRLDRLPQLVAEARTAGLDARLDVEGEVSLLPAGLELAGYRLIQESLTNARKHAPGSAVQVRLAYERDCLRIEVVDDGASPSPARLRSDPAKGQGHGLIGMAERVQVYEGRLVAGPVQGGGFRVEAILPLTLGAA